MENPQVLFRQKQLIEAIGRTGLDAFVLNPGPSFRYFTGLDFHLSERPIVAWFTADGAVGIVLPEFEESKTFGLPYPTERASYNESPETWGDAFQRMAGMLNLGSVRVGGEPRSLRLLEIEFIRAASSDIRILPAEQVTASIRVIKDAGELQSLREAVSIAQNAMRNTLPQILPGMTEIEVAGMLTAELLRAGSDPQLPFSPIVGFGPNSAKPHHFPTDRALADGDLILVDWGASSDGYGSDLTRVFAASEDLSRYMEIVQAVLEANAAARREAGPGVSPSRVDQAARGVIDKAGKGEYFTHRTGHGLGLEGHEAPYIRGDNTDPLEAGMVFTIEPGIYLAEQFGVRIEDDVVVTSTGVESLTDLPREITRLSDYKP